MGGRGGGSGKRRSLGGGGGGGAEAAIESARAELEQLQKGNYNMPQLTGSEKQISWANDIRDGFLSDGGLTLENKHNFMDAGENAEMFKMLLGPEGYDKWRGELANNAKFITHAREFAATKTDSRWWIDHRVTTHNNSTDMYQEYGSWLKKKKII